MGYFIDILYKQKNDICSDTLLEFVKNNNKESVINNKTFELNYNLNMNAINKENLLMDYLLRELDIMIPLKLLTWNNWDEITNYEHYHIHNKNGKLEFYFNDNHLIHFLDKKEIIKLMNIINLSIEIIKKYIRDLDDIEDSLQLYFLKNNLMILNLFKELINNEDSILSVLFN